MGKSRRFARILCIVLAASMVLAILLSVVVEWPLIIPIFAVAAGGGYVAYRLRAKGKGARRRK